MAAKITDKFGSVRAWVTVMIVFGYVGVIGVTTWQFLEGKITFEFFDKVMDKLDFAGVVNLVIMFYFLRQDRQQTPVEQKLNNDTAEIKQLLQQLGPKSTTT